MAQIKGAAILGTLKYVKEKKLSGGVEALVAELARGDQKVFDERIRSFTWYPYRAYAGLLDALDRKLGGARYELMPQVGLYTAQEDSRGMLKAMLTLFSPEKSLTQSGYFWRKHCDAGVFEATHVKTGRATAELREFPEVSAAHCHLLAGWLEGMGIAMGARDGVVNKTACVHRGDTLCRYEMRWS